MRLPGWSARPGNRYGDLQQDYTDVSRLQTPNSENGEEVERCGWALEVLDGHGMLGERCAELAGKALLQEIKLHLMDTTPSDVHEREAIVITAFAVAHQAALKLYTQPLERYTYPVGSRVEAEYCLTYTSGLPCYKSVKSGTERLLEFGTTCTLAVLQDQQLLIANVGDSSAVIGRRKQNGGHSATTLTVHHWGSNTKEAHRVMDAAGRKVKILPDGYLAVAAGRFKGYQLSMTRALGHNMLADFGVIPVPSVSHHTLGASDTCLLIASDGVWDSFTPLEAVEFCMDVACDGGTATSAAELLCSESVERAMAGRDHEADNTSAIVVFFQEENEQE